MPQEAYLSNASLAVNVALHAEFGEQNVMDAIRYAELEADIDHWEGGIAEEVGETGVNLSGGQKQRVNLARALHSGRPYLVLDDPLSAVGTTTEAALMDTLLARTSGFFPREPSSDGAHPGRSTARDRSRSGHRGRGAEGSRG